MPPTTSTTRLTNLLSAFRRLLASEGVAYMSYNVYPGWKSKEILRDAMLLASGDSATPEEKVREAAWSIFWRR